MRTLFILFTCFVAINLFAQPDQENLPSSEKEVIKSFNARLTEAEKLYLNIPSIKVDTNRKFLQEYKLTENPITLEYPAPEFKPLSMRIEAKTKSYPFYIKAGYGLPSAPFGALGYYHSGESYNIHTSARYQSMEDNDLRHNKFQDYDIKIASNVYVNDIIKLNIGGQYAVIDRYFLNADTTDNSVQTNRKLQMQNLQVGFQNYEPTSADIDYAFNVSFQHTKDNLFNKENNYGLSGNLNKKWSDKFSTGINLLYNSSKYTGILIENKADNYSATPYLAYSRDSWHLKGGLHLGTTSENFGFNPMLDFQYNINAAQQLFFQINTKNQLNNYTQVAKINPYFIDQLDSIQNKNTLEFKAGFDGNIQDVNISLFGAYQQISQDLFYVNSLLDSARFTNVYDDTKNIQIGLSADYEIMDDLSAKLHVVKNIYSPDTLSEAYHKVGLKLGLGIEYAALLQKKLILNLELLNQSGIKALSNEGETIDLKARMQINFGADYSLNEFVGVFVKVNNLTNNKNQRWMHYSTIGINPLIGIYAKF